MVSDTEEIVHKIQTGQHLDDREIEKVTKILMLVNQALYEKSGAMFISGYAGNIESDGLPQYVFVCPTFGADFIGTYRKQPKEN